MSHGAGSYRVESAAEREKRLLAAAMDRFQRITTELREVRQSLSLYQNVPALSEIPAIPAGASSAAVTALADQCQRLVEQSRATLTDARVAAAIAATPKIKLNFTRETVAQPAEAPRRASTTAGGARQGLVQRAEEAVAKALAKLEAEAVTPLAGKLEGLRSVAGSGRARIAFDDLLLTISELQRRQEQTRKWTAEREQLLAALDGCVGPEAEQARRRIRATQPGGPLPLSLDYVQGLAAREAAEADAQYVDSALVEVLAEMGYDVGDPPRSTIPEGMNLALPGHPRHVARIQRRGEKVGFIVAGVGAQYTSPDEDMQAETTACGVFDMVRDRMADFGITWDAGRQVEPGEKLVVHIAEPAVVLESAQVADSVGYSRSHRHRERGL